MAAAQGTTLGSLGKLTELRQRIFFLIGALIVFRLGSFIPVPGVNPDAMTSLVEGGGGLLNMVNMFSGGSLSRFSVFALGVVPYISASIVVQMMGSVIPSLQALRKEGESGRRKMTMYTRFGTVALAAFQAFGIAVALQKQVASGGAPVVYMPGMGFQHRLGAVVMRGALPARHPVLVDQQRAHALGEVRQHAAADRGLVLEAEHLRQRGVTEPALQRDRQGRRRRRAFLEARPGRGQPGIGLGGQ